MLAEQVRKRGLSGSTTSSGGKEVMTADCRNWTVSTCIILLLRCCVSCEKDCRWFIICCRLASAAIWFCRRVWRSRRLCAMNSWTDRRWQQRCAFHVSVMDVLAFDFVMWPVQKFVRGGGRKTMCQSRRHLSQIHSTNNMSFIRERQLTEKNSEADTGRGRPSPPPLNPPLL